MRITIEPTEDQSSHPFDCRQQSCTVISDGDPVYLGDVIELVKCALKGYGFCEENVNDHIPDFVGGCDEDND